MSSLNGDDAITDGADGSHPESQAGIDSHSEAEKDVDTPRMDIPVVDEESFNDIEELVNNELENDKVDGLLSLENAVSLSGSFCTEVRSLHLNVGGANSDQNNSENNDEYDVDENPGAIPVVEILSTSESDTDNEAGPPAKKLQPNRPTSPSGNSSITGPISIGKEALILASSLTPEEVAKRLEKNDEDKDKHSNGSSNLTPLAKFKRAATQVRMLCAVQLSLDKAIRKAGRSAFGGGLPDLVANMANTPSVIFTSSENKERITFNPSEFKCKYEFTWPKKARHAVEKRPENRTDDDIRLIAGLMRGLHSFRKYSKVLQDLICRVVRLQRYGRRRVVVRKGHIGYSFYFLFSGAACATLDEDEETAFMKKEVTILRKGSSFGEIALLKDVRRMATVVCLEETELLVVDRDDFFDNGLDKHIHQEFQCKLNFFKSLDLFSTWKEERVEEVSDMGRIEDYNHDSVIIKDSTENEWILFVAKGRCDVLKFVDLAKLCLAEDEDEIESKSGRRTTRGSGSREETPAILLTGDYPLSLLPSGHQSPFPWMAPQRLTARPKTTGQIAKKCVETADECDGNHNGRSQSATVRLREEPEFMRDTPSPMSMLSRSLPASPQPVYRRHPDPGIPSELKSELGRGMNTMKAPGVQAGVYVKVDSLGPGQCFGLETAVRASMPKLSVVSRGCEIIRVSMSKFREYADKTTRSKAEDMFTRCPSDFTLWNSFKKQNHWNNFKNGVVSDVLYDAHLNNSVNNSSGSHATGGTVSRDISTAATNRRRAVEISRQKNTSQITYASNPFPKISFAAEAWAGNSASPSRRSHTPSHSRSRSQHNSNHSRSASRSTHLARTISSAYSVGSRRNGTRSVSPQRAVHSRLYSTASRPRIPRIDSITKPTYTGSLSWRQLRK
ncbi:uncharacterized protein [Amphiura filiformis]|uniref:uncharacterized protein n=1 Tax=Amphiura filiformis TaxID=82378 RepID=UPI003B2221D3